MKFLAQKAPLLKALQDISGAVDVRSLHVIYGYVKIEAFTESDNGNGAGLISFVTKNADMEAKTFAVATVKQPGTAVLPMSTLLDIVKSVPSDASVDFETVQNSEQGQKVIVTSGKSKFEIGALPATEFLDTSDSELTTYGNCSISASILYHMFSRTAFSICPPDPHRQDLHGLLLHSMKDTDSREVLCAVTTDGLRLSLSEVVMPSATEFADKVFLPKRAISEIMKLLSNRDLASTDTPVKITFLKRNSQASKVEPIPILSHESDNIVHAAQPNVFIGFAFGEEHNKHGLRVYARLAENKFPDYRKVIPSSHDKLMKCDRKALLQALDRVSIIYKLGVRFSITKVGNQSLEATANAEGSQGSSPYLLTLTASNQRGEVASDEIGISFTGSDSFSASYNPKFITDVLNVINTKYVMFSFLEKTSSVLIRPDPNDETSRPGNETYVVMPMSEKQEANAPKSEVSTV